MKYYIADAFTKEVFKGNQAAVCVLDKWLPDELMVNIATENNFSETAFTVKNGDGYDLRWFTPGGEIDLCGHATMVTSYILFRFYEKTADQLTFHTVKSGDLLIQRDGDWIVMDFPAYTCKEIPVTKEMIDAMGGAVPEKAYLDRDLLLVYDDEKTVRTLVQDTAKVEQLPGLGVGITAPGKKYDCVSRFFCPKLKCTEDPVTGSVHCMIAPYWAKRLGKNVLRAYQASRRGGEMRCEVKGNRVLIAGQAALYAVGDMLPDQK